MLLPQQRPFGKIFLIWKKKVNFSTDRNRKECPQPDESDTVCYIVHVGDYRLPGTKIATVTN